MKIYIASSWKNQHAVEMLTDLLEEEKDIEVISFVRQAVNTEERKNFKFDFDKWIASEDGKNKFDYDMNGATQSDLVIYISPSGTDAWAEVGAAWASNVKVIGLFAKGENSGLMRRCIDHWFDDYKELLAFVILYKKQLNTVN